METNLETKITLMTTITAAAAAAAADQFIQHNYRVK
jgi:hypothetical protein